MNDNDEQSKEFVKKQKINIVIILLRILFICTFIISALYIINWEINNKKK